MDANLDGQKYRSDRPGPGNCDSSSSQQCPKIVTKVARHIRQSIDTSTDLLREWSTEVTQHTPCIPEQKNHCGNDGRNGDMEIDGLRLDQGYCAPHKKFEGCDSSQGGLPQVFQLCGSG